VLAKARGSERFNLEETEGSRSGNRYKLVQRVGGREQGISKHVRLWGRGTGNKKPFSGDLDSRLLLKGGRLKRNTLVTKHREGEKPRY